MEGSTPTFVFGPEFGNEDYKLMELNDEVLAAIKEGKNLYFKGEGSEDVVLCTETATFTVKTADTSNTLFLVPSHEGRGAMDFETDGAGPRHVVGQPMAYFELAATMPKLDKLKELLKQNPYRGPEHETESPEGKYTLEALYGLVQASERELRTALREAHAFPHACTITPTREDGRMDEAQSEDIVCYRVLEETYAAHVLDLMLKCALTEDWPLDKFPLKACAQQLHEHDVPDFVIRVLLTQYQQQGEDHDLPSMHVDSDGSGEEYYALSEEGICRFRAREFLTMAQRWEYDSFVATWESSLPDGMKADPRHLQGLGLISESGEDERRQKTISYFPVDSLPEDPKARFARLFEVRPIWDLESITPYVTPITSKNSTLEALLFKHARSYNKDGKKVYSKR